MKKFLRPFVSSFAAFSVVESLIAVSMVGLLAVGSANLMRNGFDAYRINKLRQDETSIGNYFLQFTDCAQTMADPGYGAACNAGRAIVLKDRDGQVILPEAGRTFDQMVVNNFCDGDEIYLNVAGGDRPDVRPLLSNVPIICRDPGPPVVNNPITMSMIFESVGKKLEINLTFKAKSVSSGADGRKIVELEVVPDSKTASRSGDFSTALEEQILAAKISAKVIFDPKNGNAPYTFEATLAIKNLVVGGESKGDQTFVMTRSGKTLDLENNEGTVKALETRETQDLSAQCKIEKTGYGLSGYYTRLTHPAPCEFNMPKIEAGVAIGQTGDIPIGTYWRYYYIRGYLHCGWCGGPKWDVTHPFPFIDGYNGPAEVAKIPKVKNGLGQPTDVWVTMDNGFLLVEPSGKVFLLADAGIGQKRYHLSISTEAVAKLLVENLRDVDSSRGRFWRSRDWSDYAQFDSTTFVELLKPSPDQKFAKGSVIALYDDTPDMSGTIDVDALTRHVITNNIGLRWSTKEELPPSTP